MDQFKQVFIEEAGELLGTLEDHLLNLEDSPDDKELVDAVFRVMHTIKGSAAMFDFRGIVNFTHVVESTLDRVRNGELTITDELIDLTLRSRDHIQNMIAAPTDVSPEFEAISAGIIGEITTLTGGSDQPVVDTKEEKEKEKENNSNFSSYRINFIPDQNILYSGTNLIALLEELHEMGEYSCIAHTENIPTFADYKPEECYINWEIFLTTKASIDEIKDVFIFVEFSCTLDISLIAHGAELLSDGQGKKLGEILVEKGVISNCDLNEALGKQRPVGKIMVEQGLLSEIDIQAALEEQNTEKRLRQKLDINKESSIRVKSGKLDSLIDSVGELVTAQARLSQIVGPYNDPSLNVVAELIERLSTELRDNAMSLRMIPVGTTFSRFKRLVRDLSKTLKKEISLETKGGETELDKSVIERLNDPLVHIIRNSIDHGIESPEERLSAGKSKGGTVTLTARYSGAYVFLEIRDDGAGLNKDRILAKAIEKGLVKKGDKLSEGEIYKLILHPGFSTAAEVTDVSGRGVGMDVVSKEIETLGGSISIQSVEGKGTNITLSLPLTLAIIEGLLVKNGDNKYVIPLASIQACLELTKEERAMHNNKRLFEFRGSMVPYVRLREIFLDDTELPDRENIVVTQTENGVFGIVVDQVVGDYQTVVKNLGKLYRNLQLITGATILGDGTMALILDLNKITSLAKKETITT